MTAAVGVLALGGVMFLRMLAVFITLPVIAVYAAALQTEPSALLSGFALGAYGITQAAAQIGFGRFADRRGRKPALLTALALFALGGLWAASASGIGELIAARLLQGAGAAAAAIMAWLGDLTSPQTRARVMAVVGVAVGAAFALSLFVAAPLAGAFGAAGVFNFSAGLGVVAFVVVLLIPGCPPPAPPIKDGGGVNSFLSPSPSLTGESPPPSLMGGVGGGKSQMKESPSIEESPLIKESPPILQILRDEKVAVIAGGAFSLHCALAVLFLLLPGLLMQSTPLAEHWRIYAPAFLLSLPPAALMIFAADKGWRKPQLAAMPAAAGLFVVCWAAMDGNGNGVENAATVPLFGGGTIYAAGLFLFFAGFNALEAILPAAASRRAGAGERGTVMGAVLSCQFAGLFAGGALGGALTEAGGGSVALAGGGILLLAWFVVSSRNDRLG